MTGGNEAHDFLYSLMRDLERCRSKRIDERDEIEDLVDAVFAPALARQDDPETVGEAMQTLRSILGGNWHSPFRPHIYGITEPLENDPEYGWTSQGPSAREVQRELRVSVRAVSGAHSLKTLRGLVLRRGAGVSEIMLAGAARERGLPVASVTSVSPDIPAFDTLIDALRHVQSLAVDTVQSTERPEGDEAVLHDAHLDILMHQIGKDAGTAALRARCLVLETAMTESRDAAIRVSDEAALRHANFCDLVRGTDLERTYFDIYANYSRAQGNPQEVEVLARAQRRIRHLEERIMEMGEAKPDDGTGPGPA